MNTYKWLLKREFWEHKGGFFWTPAVIGALMTLFLAVSMTIGLTMKSRHGMQINGEQVTNLGHLVSPEQKAEVVEAISNGYIATSAPLFFVMAFVVFFFCLGTLFDERKDRSVLFWKSLPISDRDTVVSKALGALVVAPVIAIAAAMITILGFMAFISLVVLIHGGNPYTLLWGPSNPLSVLAHLIASIPVYAVWALPTVGWLMLCSAWARSKPFLWAVMIPVFAGIFVSWFDIMGLFNMESGWFWGHIVGRSLLSAVPGGWLTLLDVDHVQNPEQLGSLLDVGRSYAVFLKPEMWIGAVAGVAMLVGAIRLRRWRDDN